MITCDNPDCANYHLNLTMVDYNDWNECCERAYAAKTGNRAAISVHVKSKKQYRDYRRDCPHQEGYCVCERLP